MLNVWQKEINMTKHEQLIQRICTAKDAKTSQWIRCTAEAIFRLGDGMPEWQNNYPLKDIKKELREAAGNISPDAFKIIPAQKKVVWWEVEITSPMSRRKINRLSDVKFELSEWDFHLEIRVVDRYGKENTVCLVEEKNGCTLLSEELYIEYMSETQTGNIRQ